MTKRVTHYYGDGCDDPHGTYQCGDDERCRDGGCPYENAADAPTNCARTIERDGWLRPVFPIDGSRP